MLKRWNAETWTKRRLCAVWNVTLNLECVDDFSSVNFVIGLDRRSSKNRSRSPLATPRHRHYSMCVVSHSHLLEWFAVEYEESIQIGTPSLRFIQGAVAKAWDSFSLKAHVTVIALWQPFAFFQTIGINQLNRIENNNLNGRTWYKCTVETIRNIIMDSPPSDACSSTLLSHLHNGQTKWTMNAIGDGNGASACAKIRCSFFADRLFHFPKCHLIVEPLRANHMPLWRETR